MTRAAYPAPPQTHPQRLLRASWAHWARRYSRFRRSSVLLAEMEGGLGSHGEAGEVLQNLFKSLLNAKDCMASPGVSPRWYNSYGYCKCGGKWEDTGDDAGGVKWECWGRGEWEWEFGASSRCEK